MASDGNPSKKTPKVIQLTEESQKTVPANSAPNKPTHGGIPGVEALKLVGSIKEKGFSTDGVRGKAKGAPVSVPEPRVTPFPQARHRSEGPHWASLNFEPAEMAEDAEDVVFESLADFARPIVRKKKRTLDFRNWKEKFGIEKATVKKSVDVEKGGQPTRISTIEDRKQGSLQVHDGMRSDKTECEVVVPLSSEISSCKQVTEELPVGFAEKRGELFPASMEGSFSDGAGCSVSVQSDETNTHRVHDVQVTAGLDKMKENVKPPVDMGHNYRAKREGLKSKLDMEEIDAENRASLQAMSIDEIKEAQAELLERLRPEVVEMLKVRGAGKVRMQNKATSDSNMGQLVGAGDEKKNLNINPSDGIVSRDSDTQAGFLETRPNESEKGAEISSAKVTGSWKTWTDRVEAVRNLRFSLDGNVVESGIGTDAANASQNGVNNSNASVFSVQNVAERDFLRTEGDPAGVGYTIKEAITLVRSMVPGQRAVALQLVGNVLDKTLTNLQFNEVQDNDIACVPAVDKSVDWQAVWSYALGPEPGLVLTLRIALDDAHTTVVVACAKVLQSLLSCAANEFYFNISESFWPGDKSLFTAPVFRKRSKFEEGFLGGGFWKYSAKPSNMFPFSDKKLKKDEEEEDTVGDDTNVASQDVAAGLIRMGILPRIRYILEMDKLAAAEEPLLSVIIALARHSSTAVDTVMKCPRLADTIIQRYIIQQSDIGVEPIQVKAVQLLKVLSQANRAYCVHLLESGVFQAAEKHLFCHGYMLEDWLKMGQESFKSICAILVEELRLWKVCIQYGLCISYFSDFYPALCFWLSPPSYEKIVEKSIVNEVLSVSRESYIVLEVLARTLPNLYSQGNGEDKSISVGESVKTWSWSQVIPMVDVSLHWLNFMENSFLLPIKHLNKQGKKYAEQDSYRISSMGVISAVLHMLSSICEKIIPLDELSSLNAKRQSSSEWLPVFLPHIGLTVIRSRLIHFSKMKLEEMPSFIVQKYSFWEYLRFLRQQSDYGTSLSAVSCLHGLFRLMVSVDKAMNIAQIEKHTIPLMDTTVSKEDEILKCGLVASSQNELKCVLSMFMDIIASEWHLMQSCETNGRGGPAPGVGVGWGAANGGFWSRKVLLAQADARFTACLLKIFPIVLDKDASELWKPNLQSNGTDFSITTTVQKINAVLSVVLLFDPRDRVLMEEILCSTLLTVPVMKFLRCRVIEILRLKVKKTMSASIGEFDREDPDVFKRMLQLHFKNRWLRKKNPNKEKNRGPKGSSGGRNHTKMSSLGTVYEESMELGGTAAAECSLTLAMEWVHQRLPVPAHWLLSPLSTFVDERFDESQGCLPTNTVLADAINSRESVIDVVRSGLFFLLGLEAMLYFGKFQDSSIFYIPLVKKIHMLSMVFILGGDVFLENQVRNLLGALQELYGQVLDGDNRRDNESFQSSLCESSLTFKDSEVQSVVQKGSLGSYVEGVTLLSLNFERDIDDSYTTFMETLTEHFGATSFGDVIYGRQVAFYLRRDVEASVRLTTWNALANAHILELLPTLEECCGQPRGYLSPPEDHEKIVEAYVSSWVSGDLDKAAARMSVTFSLALHHITAFVLIGLHVPNKLILRKRLARNLLLDSSRKSHHQAKMLELLQYNALGNFQDHGDVKFSPIASMEEIARRFSFLSEACEGDSFLLSEVRIMQSMIQKEKR